MSESLEQRALRIAYKVFTPKQLATLTHDTGPYDLTVPNFKLVEFARLMVEQEPVGLFDVYDAKDGTKSYVQIKPEYADATSAPLYAAPPQDALDGKLYLVPMPKEPSLHYLEWFVGHGLCAGTRPVPEMVEEAKEKYSRWIDAAMKEDRHE